MLFFFFFFRSPKEYLFRFITTVNIYRQKNIANILILIFSRTHFHLCHLKVFLSLSATVIYILF